MKQPHTKDSVSCYSKQGHLITENQDTMVVDKSLFIVCDGHGKNGKAVSEFVGRVLH
jgi:serine/threonine protein phosphatase PrpC